MTFLLSPSTLPPPRTPTMGNRVTSPVACSPVKLPLVSLPSLSLLAAEGVPATAGLSASDSCSPVAGTHRLLNEMLPRFSRPAREAKKGRGLETLLATGTLKSPQLARDIRPVTEPHVGAPPSMMRTRLFFHPLCKLQ